MGVDLPKGRVEPILNEAELRTVGELCEVIALCALIEDLKPVRILGQDSWEAAVFRALRGALAKAGANVTSIRPSSRLEPHLKEHGEALWLLASRWAPGALRTTVRADQHPVTNAAESLVFLLAALSVLGGVAGCISSTFGGGLGYLSFIGILMMLTCQGLARLVAWIPPRGYRWGEMETFGDVACVIAARLRGMRKA